MEISRIHKSSTSPTSIKYKFGIQVPKGIKNAINLDKKNGNNLWEEAIKTELKQFTNYETFMGVASPAYHGSIFSTFVLLYVVSSIIGGYTTARLYKSFQGEVVDQVIVWTAFSFPGLIIFVFFLGNVMLLENDYWFPAFMNVMAFLLYLWL
jgi:hypothetical protein